MVYRLSIHEIPIFHSFKNVLPTQSGVAEMLRRKLFKKIKKCKNTIDNKSKLWYNLYKRYPKSYPLV